MRRWQWAGWIAALALILHTASANTWNVIFSLGKVETLPVGSSEWRFVRSDATLGRNDLVRIPPGALLRLREASGDELPLMTGTLETTLSGLVQMAKEGKFSLQQEPPSKGVFTREPNVPDALPTGRPARERTAAGDLRFNLDDYRRWKQDTRSEHPLVRKLAREALSRYKNTSGEPAFYPTLRLRIVKDLYDLAWNMPERNSQAAALFPEAASMTYRFAALLSAAGIPTQRTLDTERRPILLTELTFHSEDAARLTANTALYVLNKQQVVSIPIYASPQSETFLEAWYAADKPIDQNTTE